MRSFIPLTLALLSAVTAFPASDPDKRQTKRILPYMWQWEIVDTKGPGCPKIDPASKYQNRPVYGGNTMDGSEIYYWFFGFPHLRATVGGDVNKASIWCEATLKYSEFNNTELTQPSADFRLKLHKNGTSVNAKYDLEEGTQAKWEVTYYPPGEEEVVDEIVVNGPIKDSNTLTTQFWSPVAKDTERWALKKCGGDQTIKFRTQLTVTATKEGAKGDVSSWQYGEEYYGAQTGITYDWEYCEK